MHFAENILEKIHIFCRMKDIWVAKDLLNPQSSSNVWSLFCPHNSNRDHTIQNEVGYTDCRTCDNGVLPHSETECRSEQP